MHDLGGDLLADDLAKDRIATDGGGLRRSSCSVPLDLLAPAEILQEQSEYHYKQFEHTPIGLADTQRLCKRKQI